MTDESLFAEALGHADPAAFLAEACKDDPARQQRVNELLAAHAGAGSFLGTPAADPNLTRSLVGDADTRSVGTTPPTPTDDEPLTFLQPPTKPGSLGRLAHYEILSRIGRGGFGIVLKAFDDRLHRVVAVKVLAPALAASGVARARFVREGRSGAAVRDEHVVSIHAVSGDDEPVPYLVMEFVAGQTLQQKLDKVGPLPAREVLRIGLQTARGLAAAHATGLIHRDIKPANVLLENGVERVKITDFGMARAADDASISQSGVVAGTPMYMSPEQARGEPLDARSDLFSLGSVLYALCTGRPPFRAESVIAVLKRVVDETPRPVREVNPEVPVWLARIVEKLHAKNPADRFQSAKEVADLLERHLAHLHDPDRVPAPEPVALPAGGHAEDERELTAALRKIGVVTVLGLLLIGMFLYVGVVVYAAEAFVPTSSLWLAGATCVAGLVVMLTGWLRNRDGWLQVAHWLLPTAGFASLGTSLYEQTQPRVSQAVGTAIVILFAVVVLLVLGLDVLVQPRATGPAEPRKARWARPVLALACVAVVLSLLAVWSSPFARRHVYDRAEVRVAPAAGLLDVEFRSDRKDAGVAGLTRGSVAEMQPGAYTLVGRGAAGRTVARWDIITHGLFEDRAVSVATPAAEVTFARGDRVTVRAVMTNGPAETPDSIPAGEGRVVVTTDTPIRLAVNRTAPFPRPGYNGELDPAGVNSVNFPAPPGEYELRAVRPDGTVFVRTFTLAVGERAEVPVTAAAFPRSPVSPALVASLREAAAAKEKELDDLLAQAQAGTVMPGPVYAAASAWTEAKIALAEAERDRDAVVAQLAQLVKDRQAELDFARLRVQAKQTLPESATKFEAMVADAKARLAKAGGQPPADAFAYPLAAGPTDLIPLARPGESQGRWRAEGGKLVHPARPQIKWPPAMPVAVRAPDEFDLEAEFERTAGADFIGFGMSARGRRFQVAFDAWKQYAGLQDVGGELLDKNPTRRKGPWLTNGKRHALRVEVRAAGVRAWLDGKEAADYRGDFAALSAKPPGLPDAVRFYVQANEDCGFVVHKLVLTPRPAAEPGFVSLFNGKDLAGWTPHAEFPGKWEVKDGVLTGTDPGYLFTARRDYRNFRLRIEARVSDGGHASLVFRCPPEVKRVGPELAFLGVPRSYRVYLHHSAAADLRDRKTGSLSIAPAGDEPAPRALAVVPDASLTRPDEWFTLELTAEGNRFRTAINGKPVADCTDPAGTHARGHLAVGVFNGPTRLQLRKVEIQELPPDAKPATTWLDTLRLKAWPVGGEVTVGFVDEKPSPHAVRAVHDAVADWGRSANLRFVFPADPSTATIRVTFDGARMPERVRPFTFPGGLAGMSAFGTDARDRATWPDATFYLDATAAPEKLAGTARHEFGHALGLVHEQDRLPADGPFNVAPLTGTPLDRFDPYSVLIQPTPAADGPGSRATRPNVLSAQDRRLVAALYPGNALPQPTWLDTLRDKAWPVGSEVAIGFVDKSPPPAAVAAVKEAVADWGRYANLNFVYPADPAAATIRVTFDPARMPADVRGFLRQKSGVLGLTAFGTDARDKTAKADATCYLYPVAAAADFAGTARHEFGHALGMVHEQDRLPRGGPFLHERFTQSPLDRFDPASVMIAAGDDRNMPAGMKSRKNLVLSAQDKRVIAAIYPGRWSPPPPEAAPPPRPARVAQRSPENQLRAVQGELSRRNPGWVGNLHNWDGPAPRVEDGNVTAIKFTTDALTHLAPLQALRELRRLDATGGKDGSGKLADLSPLAGLPLTELDLTDNPGVTDLAPLKGLKLTSLVLDRTGVTSLDAVKEMPLEVVSLMGTPVADLAPLAGRPLRILWVAGSAVPTLKGVPVATVETLGCTLAQLPDEAELKRLKVEELWIDGATAADVARLRALGGKLKYVNRAKAEEFWKKAGKN